MLKLKIVGFAVLGWLALSQSAGASTITANATIDLTAAITGNNWTGVGHPLQSSVQVSSLDTVVINISFLPGQALTWQSNGFFNPWLMLTGFPGATTFPAHEGNFEWSNVSVSLNGLTQGTQFPSAQQSANGFSGAIHLGPTFTLGNDSVTRTFTGVSLSFTATFLDSDPFRQYSTIGYTGFNLFEGSVSIAQAAAVPEPTSMLLFGTGLIGAGVRRYRQRRSRG